MGMIPGSPIDQGSLVVPRIILPNAILWRELDWMLRSYQPFIALHKGGASAEESILLDYVELGPLLTVPRALKYKHRIVLVSSLTAVLTYFFQPLTGAVLQIRQTPQIQPFTALRTETLGLSPDASNLQGFLAASGYTDASFLHNFTDDPQFVKNAWATGKFTYSLQPLLNATLKVTTHGVRVTANCSNPIEDPRMERSGTFISFNSTSVNNCEQRVVFSTSSGADNYHGVTAVGSCAPDDPSLDVSLQTIMFWFYRRGSGTSDEEVKTVFCRPFLTGTEARVYASISTGRILALETVVETAPFNDVLNGDFAGKAFNGVVFEPNEDPYVEARATAIRMQVPSTILQRMIQRDESVELAFSKPNGVLDATTAVYTRHLAVSAKSVYFVAGDSDLRGELTSIEPRLWVDPFPAHFLAAALMLTGFAGMFLHVKNRSQRKQVHLATQPGSIAATVSLTSRSGWGELLTPYDDIVALEKKMEGMKFTLDKRTGAIVAEEAAGPPAGPVLPLRLSEEFDIQMSLMGKYEPSPGVETMESSSFAAFQTAAGITPWRGKGKS